MLRDAVSEEMGEGGRACSPTRPRLSAAMKSAVTFNHTESRDRACTAFYRVRQNEWHQVKRARGQFTVTLASCALDFIMSCWPCGGEAPGHACCSALWCHVVLTDGLCFGCVGAVSW